MVNDLLRTVDLTLEIEPLIFQINPFKLIGFELKELGIFFNGTHDS